jgi:hypothetical protein
MDSIDKQVERILKHFLEQDDVNRMDTKDGMIKIYQVGDNLIRIDIKVK